MLLKVATVLGMVIAGSVSSSVESRKSLQIVPKSSVYNVGDRKAIYCKGENLDETLSWYGPDGKQIEGRSSKNKRVFVEAPKDPSPVMLVPVIIQSAKIEDTGNWTCRAGGLESTIVILVGEKARLEPSEKVTGEEGKSVTLHCIASGHPQPLARWYHDNQISEDRRITENTDPRKYLLHKQGNDQRLTIKNLAHTDAGEYTCKVTQEALSYYTDKQVTLSVTHKPVIQLVHSTEVYAILNSTKNITCSAKAFPPPEYQWFRTKNNYDDPMPPEGSIFTEDDGSYSVLMLRVYDEDSLGLYKCTASNSKGSESVVFDVSLGNKPEPPDFVEVIHRSLNELVFNVTCMNCTFVTDVSVAPKPDNLQVMGYSFQLVPVHAGYPPAWKDSEPVLVEIDDPTNTTFPVGDLFNSTTYHARVRTCNLAGCSEWLDVVPDPSTTDAGVIVTSLPSLILGFGLLILY